MSTKLEVKGLKELQEKIKKLKNEEIRKIEVRAVKAAGQVIEAKAKENVQRLNLIDTGSLLKNIGIEMVKAGQQTHGRYEVHIGVKQGKSQAKQAGGKDPYYWIFSEFGTSKQAPQPFLRPALEENIEAALNAYQAVFKKILEKK